LGPAISPEIDQASRHRRRKPSLFASGAAKLCPDGHRE
jgi:hypothetical protein